VQVFEHEEQGLHLALAQEEALDRVKGLLAPAHRIEGLPLRVLGGHVEQREEGRERILQGPIERQQFAGELLADFPAIIAGLDLEVGPEQVYHGQVGRGCPVGH
jgi:hypothetical protein